MTGSQSCRRRAPARDKVAEAAYDARVDTSRGVRAADDQDGPTRRCGTSVPTVATTSTSDDGSGKILGAFGERAVRGRVARRGRPRGARCNDTHQVDHRPGRYTGRTYLRELPSFLARTTNLGSDKEGRFRLGSVHARSGLVRPWGRQIQQGRAPDEVLHRRPADGPASPRDPHAGR